MWLFSEELPSFLAACGESGLSSSTPSRNSSRTCRARSAMGTEANFSFRRAMKARTPPACSSVRNVSLTILARCVSSMALRSAMSFAFSAATSRSTSVRSSYSSRMDFSRKARLARMVSKTLTSSS